MTKKTEYKFRSQDFYKLLESQNYRCPVSGRKLTPENTTACHKVPLKRGGTHCFENIYLLVAEVARLKKDMLDEELVALCEDIIKTRNVAGVTSNEE